jgi:tetratricopeptide (TPR) repeat protein
MKHSMNMKNKNNPMIEVSKKGSVISTIVFSTIALFFVFSFIFWTVIPYYQMIIWKHGADAVIEGNDLQVSNNSFVYTYYNTSTQASMRVTLFMTIFNQYVHGVRTGYTPLYDTALNQIKEWVDVHPYRFDYLLVLAKGYELKANLTHDTSLYAIADEYYQKAIALCPDRQDLLYAYAEHLSNTGKNIEALSLLQRMYEQNPNITQTKYYLGVVLGANGKQDYDKALVYLEDSFGVSTAKYDTIVVKAIYEHFFVYFYEKGDVQNFRKVVRRLLWVDPSQHDAYTTISDYIDAHQTIPLLNIHTD